MSKLIFTTIYISVLIYSYSAFCQDNTEYDTDAELLETPDPSYPILAKLFEISGWCKIKFDITVDGNIKNQNILECWPEGYFEKSALDVAMKYKYSPALKDNIPTEKKHHVEEIMFFGDSDKSNRAKMERMQGRRMMRSMTMNYEKNINKHIRQNKKMYEGINTEGAIDYVPIMKSQPVYPQDALRLGLEGYCVVEFDVTEKGATANNRVVECNPSDIFAPHSIAATRQFFYIPALMNWAPIITTGIRNKITFKIEGENAASNKKLNSTPVVDPN